MNFSEGIPEKVLTDLEQDYNHIDLLEETRSARVSQQAGIPDHRVVTFIPPVIAEYESYWKRFTGEE